MTRGLEWWHRQVNAATARREERLVRQFGLRPVVSNPYPGIQLPGEVWAWQVPVSRRARHDALGIASPVRVGFAGNKPHTGHLGLARVASELAGRDGKILVFDASGDSDRRMVDAFRAAPDYFATDVPEVRVVGDEPDVRRFQRQAARALPLDRVRRIYGLDVTTPLATALDVAEMLAFFLFAPHDSEAGGVALVDAPQATHSAALSHIARALDMTPPALLYRRLLPHLRRSGERGSVRAPDSVMFLDDDTDTVRAKFGRAITGGRPTTAEQHAYGGDPTRCSAFATVELLCSPHRARTMLAECRAGEVTCSGCKAKNADAVVDAMRAITERLRTRRAGTSPEVGPALRRTARTLHRPPPRECDELEAAIAAQTGIRPDQVVAGNGSTEVMDWLFRLQAQPGTQVVATEPAFELHRDLARRHRLSYDPVPWTPESTPDLPELGRTIGERTALVVVELPHSVSGTVVSPDAVIKHLVPRLPSGARILLDLAYADFMDTPPHLSADLIEDHPEIVAFGTLSKAHCLLGARVGYALAATATAKRLRQQRLPYALDALATAAAQASLADHARFERTIQANRAARARLTATLDEHGIAYVPSQANFLLMNLAGSYLPVIDRLRARNARYRDGHRWDLPGWIQVHLVDVPTVTPVIEAIETAAPGRP